ncbi:MAG TPA: hypothetical protein VNT26_11690, partial [Candidatus Sulfotelmatobacter sp.]|nr:hypothetical protein [Candidatus Sulfotelmatobacter sp.]
MANETPDSPTRPAKVFSPWLVTLNPAITGGVNMESVLGLVRHSGNDGLFRAIEMSLLAAAA